MERKHKPYRKFQGFMREHDITVQDIADLLESTTTVVSAKNNGHSDYRVYEINKICNAYGCTIDIFRQNEIDFVRDDSTE